MAGRDQLSGRQTAELRRDGVLTHRRFSPPPKSNFRVGAKEPNVRMKRPLMKRGGHFLGEADSAVANKKHDCGESGSPESGGGG